MIIRKAFVAVAIVAMGLAGCNDAKKNAPAQNAQPAGEQMIVGKDSKSPNGKGKGRTMPAPPPIAPID